MGDYLEVMPLLAYLSSDLGVQTSLTFYGNSKEEEFTFVQD
jgi:hypothetical protein